MRRLAAAAALCASSSLVAFSCAAAPPKRAASPAPGEAEAAAALIGGALTEGGGLRRLGELTDTVGPRLSGSPGAAAAVAWAQAKFAEDGIAVHTEPVLVPHWVRGDESGEIVAPALAAPRRLSLTALGGSAGTPGGGLTAEVIEVSSIDELNALGEQARGKIVLFQHGMSTASGYGENASLRSRGPLAAARLGAAAALVRSLATASLRSPHTGMMLTDSAVPTIPGAALATEDAELIHRLLAQGKVSLHLTLGCQTLPDEPSFNVVAEVRGREKPEEVVLLGAHLDSWDLAQGAVDDGAGVVIVMEALRLISRLRAPPRRTVRVVLFMNEENGIRGALAYAAQHASEIKDHVAALECDSGAGRPLSFTVHAGAGAASQLQSRLGPLDALGCSQVVESDRAGTDITPLAKSESPPPFVELVQDSSRYFDIHHSAADTFDKVEPRALAESCAAVTFTAWTLAEMPEPLPRPAKKLER